MANNCQVPEINEQLSLKVKHRPAVPDNEDHWQVFESEKHIDDFLKSENDFSIPTPEASHEEKYLYIEQIPEAEMTYPADINHCENPFEVEVVNNEDQEDLEVL